MPKRDGQPQYALVPLNKIDPPALAMRQTFDEQKLEDLTESVKKFGVLLPICLAANGSRYQIQDGHRRFLAATRAGRVDIPAVIRTTAGTSTEAVKVHANLFREDVNPAEQAVYFGTLLTEHCAGDVDRLVELTGLKRPMLEDRLNLLLGDDAVFAALKEGRISLAVSKELNKVRDDGYRAMYLDVAIAGGASARLVIQWRTQSDAIAAVEAPPAAGGENQFTTLPAPITTMTCICCESADRPWEMELIPMHRQCRAMFIDRALARIRAALGEAVQGVPHSGTTGPTTSHA
ncbi:MAG: ParB/RepB/Spo0J family partition protein [Bryobacteraceae bacterium]|jgi:ParB/RepB/Spo0J family partition protein